MRGEKVNVIDIIEENSKTKQNECVSYERRKKSGKKKNLIVLVLLTRVYQSMNFFFFHLIKSSNIFMSKLNNLSKDKKEKVI